ncbi:MAG: RNA-binding protein [Sneathiella sp.]
MKKRAIPRKLETPTLRQQRDLSETVRRCIATGQTLKKEELLRFVVSPDGGLVYDNQGKLPGRGIWVSSNRDSLELARKKGMFARSAKRQVSVAEDLIETVIAALTKRCLDLLGLSRKGGHLATGFAKVEASLKNGKAFVLLAAHDGADDGRQKLRRLAGSRPLVELFSSDELSKALGRENMVHAAIARGGLSDKFLVEVSKLNGFRDVDGEDGRSESE